MKPTSILVISNPQDGHTRFIVERLQERSATVTLFHPEMLGHRILYTMSSVDDRYIFSPSLRVSGSVYHLSEFQSVWYRRPRPIPPALVDIEDVSVDGIDFAQNEWNAVLESTYALVTKPLWVSHPDNLKNAVRKPLQLLLAKQLGLTIPKTLITNDPDEAKSFFDLCNGKVVVKAVGNGWFQSASGEHKRILTNRVDVGDLYDRQEIMVAPITFQEEVTKAYEVRLNIVGQNVLAIRIDSQLSEISKLDWRRYDINNTPYSPYHIPREVEVKCLQLAQRLGLEFGAIDLIVTPSGEYVFLEINPNGQFLWAEKLSGVKVSDLLVDLLLGNTKPLYNAKGLDEGIIGE